MAMKLVCRHTHGLLTSGLCPWCGQPVVSGQLRPDVAPRDVADRRWNIPVMMQALDHEDWDLGGMVVSNLLLHGPEIGEALPLLRKALGYADDRRHWMATQALHRYGHELLANDVERWEQAVQQHPDDLALHI